MSFPPAQELPVCLVCNDFRSSDPLTLLDHQIECQKLPEHQGKYDEFMVNFVTSLARKCTEERLSDLYKTENAARDPKLAARLAKSDNKRDKKGLKTVAPGTAVTTGNVEKAAECDRIKARDNGSGRGTGGKKSNKKGWSRGRGRGDRGIHPMGRGCGGNKSPEQFEQVINGGGVVLKEGSQATADSKDNVITDHLIDTDLLNLSVELIGLNMSTGILAARNDVTSADAMKRSTSNTVVINEPREQSRGRGRGGRGIQPMGRGCGGNKSPVLFEQVMDGGVVLKEASQATADSKDSVVTELNSFVEWMGLNMSTGRLARNDVTREPREIGLSADAMKRSSSNAVVINEPREQSRASYSHAGYSGRVQEGKGKQPIQEDVDKMALKRGIENSLNVYGEGSSTKAALDTDEVEGEVILYKGKNTSNDSDEVEGEVIVYKGRNYA